jgi:hypothetical protein
MHPASRIVTNLDDVSALASRPLRWPRSSCRKLLERRQLGAFAVRPCLLDLQFDVTLASKRITFPAVPRGTKSAPG